MLRRYAHKAYTGNFLKLSKQGKVRWLNEASLREASRKTPQVLEERLAEYITKPTKVVGGFYDPALQTVFLHEGKLGDVSAAAVHEITHRLEKLTEFSSSRWRFHTEYRAFRAQQQFLRSIDEVELATLSADNQSIRSATSDQLAERVERDYNCTPDPALGVDVVGGGGDA